jgi:hypothetical protein
MNNKEKRSISELEGWIWNTEIPVKENTSYEEYNFYVLHNKPIKDYSNKDLYFMIGQESGLKYFVPLAIKVLSTDLFLQADDYPGDLLHRVLSLEKAYWIKNPPLYKNLHKLIINIKVPKTLKNINALIENDLNYFINLS